MQLWDLHWVQLQVTFLCVVLKVDGFKSVLQRSYVDDTFLQFSSPDHSDKLKEHLSSKHLNIDFREREKRKMVVYLFQMLTFATKFSTNVYRKKTLSGVYINFKSFITETYKIGLIKSLSFCGLNKNSYPRNLVDKYIKACVCYFLSNFYFFHQMITL